MDCFQRKTIFAKIGVLGARVREYCLDDSKTIGDALKAAGIQVNHEKEEIIVNGLERTLGVITYLLKDGDLILIKKKLIIPLIKVKVARLNESLMEISVPEGSIVEKALIAAGRLPFNNEEIWVHFEGCHIGEKVLLQTKALAGSIIIIEPKKDPRKEIIDILGTIDGEDLDFDASKTADRIINLAKQVK